MYIFKEKNILLNKIMKRNSEEVTKENDKSFVNDGMSTPDIRDTVAKIRRVYKTTRESKLKSEFSFFVERYPMLYDMCIRDDFNPSFLEYFLLKRDEIINNKISAEDASKKVGQEWFEKFVKVDDIKK